MSITGKRTDSEFLLGSSASIAAPELPPDARPQEFGVASGAASGATSNGATAFACPEIPWEGLPDNRLIRITGPLANPDALIRSQPLYRVSQTRALEAEAMVQQPPFALMALAGLQAAKLASALCPHGKKAWILAGPGNNGGDGLVLAKWLHQAAWDVWVSHVPPRLHLPADAARAMKEAIAAGVPIHYAAPPLNWQPDLIVDALLGLGQSEAALVALSPWLERAQQVVEHSLRLKAWQDQPVDQPPAQLTPSPGLVRLALDLPTGLCADTGRALVSQAFHADACLSFMSLKPGLFTAEGRGLCGQIWLAPLVRWQPAAGPSMLALTDSPHPTDLTDLTSPRPTSSIHQPSSWLTSSELASTVYQPRSADSHKGTFGDVWLIGGAPGMSGALTLASRSALNAGAGRVFSCRLDGQDRPSGPSKFEATAEPKQGSEDDTDRQLRHDPEMPECMPRARGAWRETNALQESTIVFGCGAGQKSAEVLEEILSSAHRLVLDADGLNLIAGSETLALSLRHRCQQGHLTILTPHPLEAARLLKTSVREIQTDRIDAAKLLAEKYQSVVVLKGSGSLISEPSGSYWINSSGNARLSTAGSGDVLSGWIGGTWSASWSASAHLFKKPTDNKPGPNLGNRDIYGELAKIVAAAVWCHGQAADILASSGDLRLPLAASRQIAKMRDVVAAL